MENYMSEEEAATLKVGESIRVLVGGCGGIYQDDGGEEELEYKAGEIVTVDWIDHFDNDQKLAITIIASNGVVNVFDAMDYDGKYPFKRLP